MSTKNFVFLKIQEMKEDDFSKKIVIPLLRKMGYTFTDFNGGAYELGKDIIAHKKNEFGELEVVAIQSKKLKSERTAVHSQKFGEIVHQLRYCVDKKIACIDGTSRYPSKVILITPFPIDTRSLTEQLEQIQVHRVMLIDEGRLASLLEEYWPEIFSDPESELGKAIALTPGDTVNFELYQALHIDSKTNYSSYYSDLNFFVGKTESQKLLKSTIEIVETVPPPYNSVQWNEIKKTNQILYELTGQSLILEVISEVEKNHNSKLTAYNSPKNKFNIEKHSFLVAQADKINAALNATVNIIMQDAKANIVSSRSRREDNVWQLEAKILDGLASQLHANVSAGMFDEVLAIANSIRSTDFYHDTKKIIPQIKSVAQLITELRGITSEETQLALDLMPVPLFSVVLNIHEVQDSINIKIKKFSEKLSKLSNLRLTSAEVRHTLDEINHLLRTIDKLSQTNPDSPTRLNLIDGPHSSCELDISAHKVFDSGANIAVYGDAGAGKSTTLYVYAEKIYKNKSPREEVLFIPLNRITNALSKLSIEEREQLIKEGEDLNSLINSFLLYRGVPVSAEARKWIMDNLSSKDKTTIIVDALDEAVSNASWVIPALSEIPKKIRNAQVITSSRTSVSFVKNIEFLGITLLPFNSLQLKRFIFGWMKDPQHSEDLWKHIEVNDLLDVAKNPLLATIICSLHESGIPIPENEPDVYRRKMELLCGVYDQSKGISRTSNDRIFLESCAQKIAYQMHARSQREATREELTDYLYKAMETRVSQEKTQSVIHDLIDVCNVITRADQSNYFSFGHLRIQEALAAEELGKNRAIDIVGLIPQQWWGGALYLYSFKNSIQPLFDAIYERSGSFTKYRQNLITMISSQPKSIQTELHALLERHSRTDESFDVDPYGHGDGTYSNLDDPDLKNMLGY